jgi:hypothetical protein
MLLFASLLLRDYKHRNSKKDLADIDEITQAGYYFYERANAGSPVKLSYYLQVVGSTTGSLMQIRYSLNGIEERASADGDGEWEEWASVKGGGDAIKKITITQGMNTQELTPDESGNVDMEIPRIEVDETLTEGGTNPVQGGAILNAIKENEGLFGADLLLNTIGEGDDKAYSLSLLDKNGEVLSTTETFTGGGGSGSAVGTKVVLTRITANPTVKFGDRVQLQFLYDQIDASTNDSTGNSGTERFWRHVFYDSI